MAQQIETDVYYPESDGQPVGETELHRQLLWDLVYALTRWLAGRADAHVSGNLFIYYVKGQPNQVVCPDVFVAFGSHKRRLNTYRTWRDGPFPQVVIELTTSSTRAEDQGPKVELYERLGVLEYYLFDPHFDPDGPDEPQGDGDLMCYRRPSASDPFGAAARVAVGAVIHSDALGLGLTVRGAELRLVDEAANRLLPTPDEEAMGREAAEAARLAAEERAQALAEELARLRAERREHPEV